VEWVFIPVNLGRCLKIALAVVMSPFKCGARRQNVKTSSVERFQSVVDTHWAGVAIWVLVASIFLFDVFTHPENVSACFAYTIPIFVSLFEARPRPFLYAGVATALSLIGMFVEPSGASLTAAIIGNRLIAIATQWLAAMLVKLQYRRHSDMQRAAELQRRLVDILSHEIGTALTAITGQAYRLTKLSGQIAPGDLRVRAEKIRNAAERIEAIVDRVQFASSLGNGTIPVGHSAIDVNAVIQKLTHQLREEQQGRPIELNLCPEPQLVEGDETLLRQAFENIIVNSVKYSSCGSPISVSTEKHGSVLRVAIADCGEGIAACDLTRVREPYYRGSSSKGTSGAGLGLFFVERIVEAHNGAICIESELGQGTRVTIDLQQSR
jgi:signal transduction histidine kinase